MNKHFQLIGLFTITVFLNAVTGFAQDDEAATTQTTETDVEEAAPAGQEVEINEDNYRQFMELKDARRQRNMLPENSYQSQAGTQKIDKLPEESQKHLRNELREIIIQGDQWQPGDENTDYPYVPSNAASTNPALQKQEAEAWGELVGNYHKREAEMYGNASRSQAASAATGAAGEGAAEGSGEDQGSAGGKTGQAGEGQQTSQQNSSKQSSTAGSYSPNASDDPNAKSTAGVSQNAMEFLKGQGNQVANAGEANTASSEDSEGQANAQAEGQAVAQAEGQADAQTDGQANAQAGQQADGQAQADQQSADEQNRTASTSSYSTSPPSPDEPESDSTAGASQNALEYLMGDQTETSQTTSITSESEESAFEENPLPELPSLRGPGSDQPASPGPGNQEGTLTIEDLINAQGVRDATNSASPSSGANGQEEPEENTPGNSGDG